ncbi:MAG TPA: DUF3488 and transglutaminase-like domain-containing protein [Sporichthyaceae bacterium]|jgi:transglutaminase-like putative cysteine protease|nr:DUF3488 and transglutaminase-like domain-containing protein [Sporichthyaceae bacterium]
MTTTATRPQTPVATAGGRPGVDSPLRRGILGWLAAVLAVSVLFSELHGGGWYARSVGVMTLIAALGVGGRSLRLNHDLIVVCQLVAGFEFVLLMFTPGELAGGTLPTRAAFRQLGHLTRTAWHQLFVLTPPLHPDGALTFAVVCMAALVALAVDLVAGSAGKVALAGVPLLAMEIFPVAFGQESGALFLAPAVAFLMLIAEKRDRLAPRIGVVVLALAMVVPSVTPKINGRYEAHKGFGQTTKAKTITTLNPLVTMRGDLVQPIDTDLMNITTTSAHPGDVYLRTVTLDSFDGTEWKAGKRKVDSFDPQLADPVGLSPAIDVSPVDTTISAAAGFESDYLPMPYPTIKVTVPGQWRLDPLTENIVSHKGRDQISGLNYSVTSDDLNAKASDVASNIAITSYLEPYLQLPTDIAASVKQAAQRITADAKGPLEIGQALQAWFTAPGNFVYDLKTTPGTGDQAIVDFLRFRHGFCEQFAATMAVMARMLGIPARVDVGFTSGRLGDAGNRIISAHDAHAWPELWLPNIGWERFEPTPGSASSDPHAPNWLITKQQQNQTPDTGQSTESTPSPQPGSSSAGSSAGASSADSGQADCSATPDAPQCQSPNTPPTPNPPAQRPLWKTLLYFWSWLPLLLLLSPALVRVLRRRRRWAVIAAARAPGAAAADAAEAAWSELRDEALDLGYPWPVARTPRQTSAQLTADGGLSAVGAGALTHVSGTVERTRYARAGTAVAVPDQLRAAAIHVEAELRRNAGPWRRVLAVALPKSLWVGAVAVVNRGRADGRPWARALLPRRAGD